MGPPEDSNYARNAVRKHGQSVALAAPQL
jgi:hypothetical protein